MSTAALPAPGTFNVASVLMSLESVRSSRPVAARVMAMADDPEVTAAALADVATTDPVLTAKVLQLANSAAYAVPGGVATVRRAVVVVGTAAVRALAAVAVTGLSGPQVPEVFWRRAVTTAVCAAELAPRFGLRGSDLLCVGMLTSLGSVLLHAHDAEWYGALLAAQPTRREAHAAEYRRYGMTSTGLTAEALRQWSFPLQVVTAVSPGEVVSPAARCVLVTHEVVGRVLDARHRSLSVEGLSAGLVRDADVDAVLPAVGERAAALLAALS